MFKAIASLATAGILAISGAAAQAESWRHGRLLGYNVKFIDRPYVDSVVIPWTNGDFTHFSVTCSTQTFKTSHGAKYVTFKQAQAITHAWCFG